MVKNLSDVTAVVGGSEHSLALDSKGTVWAWGNGTQGELGQGSGSTFSASPLKVPGLSGMTAIAAGDQHSLALKSDGTVWAWGANNRGQIGIGTSGNDVFSPVQVSGLTGVVAIAAGHGGNTSYALKSDGTVWAWGYDAIGELGDGTADVQPHPAPTKVSNLTGVVAIGAGADHGLAVESDGSVWAWASTCTDNSAPRPPQPASPRSIRAALSPSKSTT